ncbi:BQ5605_C017g08442 [Microbotryum silenes-dioicae]|uniref:BQ5605_C017g08442 protein n=1 Tax=Microbotryum silenes-dioicae TaxID=796604 RepID=A0A2X0NYA6_9BASI|nr:BQ5605_C017g08442 [Microbotryum silenes-dioicae]
MIAEGHFEIMELQTILNGPLLLMDFWGRARCCDTALGGHGREVTYRSSDSEVRSHMWLSP